MKANRLIYCGFLLILFINMLSNAQSVTASTTQTINGITFKITTETILKNCVFDAEGRIINGTLKKAQFDNTTFFNADILNGSFISIDILYTPEVPKEPEPEQKPLGTLDFVPAAQKANEYTSTWVFWAVLTCIICLLIRAAYKISHEPYIFVADSESFKDRNLGRFIRETPLGTTGLWKYHFKTLSGKNQFYYGDRSFGDYQIFLANRMGLWHFYRYLVLKTVDIPKNVVIEKKKLLRTWKNLIFGIPYAIFSAFLLNDVSTKIYNKMDFEPVAVTQFEQVMCVFMTEQLDTRFDVEYEKNELNTTTGKIDWIKHKEAMIPISEIFTIKKNNEKIRNFQFMEVYQNTIKFDRVSDCARDIRSRLNDRGHFENQKLFFEQNAADNYQLYQITQDQLETRIVTEQERFDKMYQKLQAYQTSRNEEVTNLLTDFNKFRRLTGDENDSIQKAILKKIDEEFGAESKMLLKENAELKAQNAILNKMFRKKVKNIETNDINVRSEFDLQNFAEEDEET